MLQVIHHDPSSTIYRWSDEPAYERPGTEPDVAFWKDQASDLHIYVWRDRLLGCFSAAVGTVDPDDCLDEYTQGHGKVVLAKLDRSKHPAIHDVYSSNWLVFRCDQPGDRCPGQLELAIGEQPVYRDFNYVKKAAERLALEHMGGGAGGVWTD